MPKQTINGLLALGLWLAADLGVLRADDTPHPLAAYFAPQPVSACVLRHCISDTQAP